MTPASPCTTSSYIAIHSVAELVKNISPQLTETAMKSNIPT